MLSARSRTQQPDDLDGCDGYLVIVADPDSRAMDAYGPLDEFSATREVDLRRQELDTEQLYDIFTGVVRWHHRSGCRRRAHRVDVVPVGPRVGRPITRPNPDSR